MEEHERPPSIRSCARGAGHVLVVAGVALVAIVAAATLQTASAFACPIPSGAPYGHSCPHTVLLEYAQVCQRKAEGPEDVAVLSEPWTNVVVVSSDIPGAEPSPAGPLVSAGTGTGNLLHEDLRRIYGGRIEIDPRNVFLLAAAGGTIMLVDEDLYGRITSGPRDPGMDRCGDVITDLGSGVATLGIAGLVALHDPQTGYLAANAVVYSGLSCAVLKAAFGRARPGLGEGPYAFGGPCIRDGYNSMPSGHSAAAFALATVLARQYPRYRVFFYAGATLVAISRVYERAHWPSDTLIGAAIGVWSANQVMGRSRLFEITW
ncbi:MAG: phosphatase PAP2 family protein [Bacillota bacterium]